VPKLVKVMSENVNEGFYDDRGGSYDVNLKITGVCVILNLCYITVDGYWWNSLVNVNYKQWLRRSHGANCLGQVSLS
jgi:hypothetical protein